MQGKRPLLTTLSILVALAFLLSGCGGSSASSKTAGNQAITTTKVENPTDAKVEVVSVDEGGITLALSVDQQNLAFFPQSFEVAGDTYSIFDAEGELNPAVHFVVDGNGKDSSAVEIAEGETHEVRVSIDGVSDYTHFTMRVDNTVFDDSGKAWPIRDVRVTCITE